MAPEQCFRTELLVTVFAFVIFAISHFLLRFGRGTGLRVVAVFEFHLFEHSSGVGVVDVAIVVGKSILIEEDFGTDFTVEGVHGRALFTVDRRIVKFVVVAAVIGLFFYRNFRRVVAVVVVTTTRNDIETILESVELVLRDL